MKALVLVFVLFGVTGLRIVDEVPKAVKKAFDEKYDLVKDLNWEEEGYLYHASFKHEDAYKVASFEKDGTWTKTMTTLEIDKLDSCMVDFIKEDYPRGEIAEANFVELPGTTKYEILIRTSEEVEEEEEQGEELEVVYEFIKLLFSGDCEFLGEEEN